MKIVKSIVKVSKVLNLFSPDVNSLTLGEIARSLNVDEATISHTVSTMVVEGFLKQTKKRGKYSLGGRFLELGVNINYSRNGYGATSYLIELSKLINETVHLSFWNGSNILYTKAPDYYNESFNFNPIDWEYIPLHCTAMGKLILSEMSNEDIKKYFRINPLKKRTPNTIIDLDRMKEHLLSVKREGIACELGEASPGINSIAAGIKNRDGEIIGCIIVTGPARRLTSEAVDKIKSTIKLCALKISWELGYQS